MEMIRRRGFLKCMSALVIPIFIPARVIPEIVGGMPGETFIPLDRLLNARIGINYDFLSPADWFDAIEERWGEVPVGAARATVITSQRDQVPEPFTVYNPRGKRYLIANSDRESFVMGDVVQVRKFAFRPDLVLPDGRTAIRR